MLILGPKAAGNDIDVYLQPLVHELKEPWQVGVQTYDASMDELFQLHVAIVWTINNFPAYAYLSRWSTKGKLACPTCNIEPSSFSLHYGKKICYMGHRRFLPSNHKWQNCNWFGGKDHRLPPKMLSGFDVLEQLQDFTQPTFGKAHGRGQQRKMADKLHNWTKKSIFFDLSYWRHLKIRHNFDVMHIDKNVCDSLLGTMMNIEGKTKDTYNSQLDLERMHIQLELHPVCGDGVIYLPTTCYMLTHSEKTSLCQFLSSVKLPNGYAYNISRCESLKDNKIAGLKSHDCHILMQCLLLITVRAYLRKDIGRAIIKLCMFFRDLTFETLRMDVLEQLDHNIALTLCSLETIFPPSFFDVMVHLPIHLAREAMITGPCQFQYLHKLKGYVRNKAHPEDSIAKGYIDCECLTFCSLYLDDVETIFNRPYRNLDGDGHRSSLISTFSHNGHGVGAPILDELNSLVHLSNTGSTIDLVALKSLARGPNKCFVHYTICIINGHRFCIAKHDMHKTIQNSGIFVKGEHNGDEIDFFGVLTDIMELSYGEQNAILLFKCDWWDIGSTSQMQIDEFKFTSINVIRMWYKDDPYVLASQAEDDSVSRLHVEHLQAHCPVNRVRVDRKRVIWTLPSAGYVKINVDGALKEDNGVTGVGVAIRNSDGDLMAALFLSFKEADRVAHAVARHALTLDSDVTFLNEGQNAFFCYPNDVMKHWKRAHRRSQRAQPPEGGNPIHGTQ
nr:uncharacterized protein LOC107428797 [Ziziphus jujuba var. spinosa]